MAVDYSKVAPKAWEIECPRRGGPMPGHVVVWKAVDLPVEIGGQVLVHPSRIRAIFCPPEMPRMEA